MLRRMSWEGLFADLEGQFEALERRDLDAEVADRTRRERAAVPLAARLVGHLDRPLTVRLVTTRTLTGTLADLGQGWFVLLVEGRSVLVADGAVVGYHGLGLRAEPEPATTRARRFGLAYALRGLSRDRAVVTLTDRSGRAVTGTIDRAGADHLDLAEHAPDEPRRQGNVRAVATVPYAALVTVASA